MILAPLAAAPRYLGLHPRFAAAFAWCRSEANLASADGRYQLEGEQLMVIVETGTTHPSGERRLESHRRYIDIQVNLEGPEAMEWTPVKGLAVETAFSEEGQSDNDIAFYAQPATSVTRLLVMPRHFAIFWPEDAHKPVLHPGSEPVRFRKLVFKVAKD